MNAPPHQRGHLLTKVLEGVREFGVAVRSDRWLAFSNHGDSASSCLVFLFDREPSTPAIVAKITDDADLSQREFGNQKRAYELVPHNVPRPLGSFPLGSLTVNCSETMQGSHVSGNRDKWRYFDRVVESLLQLHKAAWADGAGETIEWRSAEKTLTTFKSLCDEPSLCRYAEQCNRTWSSQSSNLTLVPQHGDFRYMNILIGKESVGFLDWEYFGVEMMPCYDVYCLLLDTFFCDKSNLPYQGRAVRKYAPVVRDSLSAYFELLSIPAVLTQSLLEWSLFQQYIYSVANGESSGDRLLGRIRLYSDNVAGCRDRLIDLMPRG